mmetsp:Transcript_69906/g.194422  ORF Transcript_69906/g.194422 Transcript_69906/m.194422 type:complete len:355 (+) Transcript_69906:173-1237(+)
MKVAASSSQRCLRARASARLMFISSSMAAACIAAASRCAATASRWAASILAACLFLPSRRAAAPRKCLWMTTADALRVAPCVEAARVASAAGTSGAGGGLPAMGEPALVNGGPALRQRSDGLASSSWLTICINTCESGGAPGELVELTVAPSTGCLTPEARDAAGEERLDERKRCPTRLGVCARMQDCPDSCSASTAHLLTASLNCRSSAAILIRSGVLSPHSPAACHAATWALASSPFNAATRCSFASLARSLRSKPRRLVARTVEDLALGRPEGIVALLLATLFDDPFRHFDAMLTHERSSPTHIHSKSSRQLSRPRVCESSSLRTPSGDWRRAQATEGGDVAPSRSHLLSV